MQKYNMAFNNKIVKNYVIQNSILGPTPSLIKLDVINQPGLNLPAPVGICFCLFR